MNERGWPEFPLFWLDELRRKMEGLRDVALHLHGKTAEGRQASAGFRGTANEMEVQIIEALTSLQQQVYVLSDVVQSTLQIIAADHEQRTTKGKRALTWIRETAKRWERVVAANVVYRIIAMISGLATVWFLVRWFLVYLHRN